MKACILLSCLCRHCTFSFPLMDFKKGNLNVLATNSSDQSLILQASCLDWVVSWPQCSTVVFLQQSVIIYGLYVGKKAVKEPL